MCLFLSIFCCFIFRIFHFSFLFFIAGFGPADIGYVVRSNMMSEVVSVIKSASNQSTSDKLQKVRDARYLYTYTGLLGEIEKWFIDPFGPYGGYLRCKNDDKKAKMYTGISTL
jgi:hypothetical protein